MFTLPDLPYSFDALEPYIDAQTMEIHHDKHHATYVKNLNEVLAGDEKLLNMDIADLIKNLDEVPEDIRNKVRNNGGGHLNHSLFWEYLSPDGGGKPEGELLKNINEDFGSFEKFMEDFTNAGLGRFGSGWAWLVLNNKKLEIVDTPNQDLPTIEGKVPILGIDVWEHAYYLKYQNKRADYLKAFWNIINWKKVEELHEIAFKMK